jgi:FtsZ-binding cell division protein ZapB
MNDEQKWENPLENDGITLGPEEALQREIEKSKSLKVDRLRLKDEIEQLKAQKAEIKDKNSQLQERIKALSEQVTSSRYPEKYVLKKNIVIAMLIVILIFSLILFLLR